MPGSYVVYLCRYIGPPLAKSQIPLPGTLAGSKLVADRFEDGHRPAWNLSATSFEPVSNQLA